jgi:hypothetical protein
MKRWVALPAAVRSISEKDRSDPRARLITPRCLPRRRSRIVPNPLSFNFIIIEGKRDDHVIDIPMTAFSMLIQELVQL